MELNKYIDHTLLKPDATADDILHLCDEAIQYKFFSVVVNPVFVFLAKQYIKDSNIKICSVVGFPLGSNLTETKVNEARSITDVGGDEIDIVANIGWIQSGEFEKVKGELEEIRGAISSRIVTKVIIETPVAKPANWPGAVEAVIASGADFVKSATGFVGSTPVDHIQRLDRLVKGRIKIKAAGGIKTADDALAMIEAGAARLGCSSSVAVMEDYFQSRNM